MKRIKEKKARSTKGRRRIASFLAIAIGLIAAGSLYTLLVPTGQTANAAADPAVLRKGEQIFNNTCISCHGANLQGVKDRGPSLVGVGSAAVYFQTSTGRMPAMAPVAQAERKPAALTADQIDALMAYIESIGGGPAAPSESGTTLQGTDPARGGQLFRLNCASCHNFTARGGALSSGKTAPTLEGVSEKEIYTAMQSGPENMPKFSDRQLTPEEKKDIIAYIKSVSDNNNNPGGYALGGLGPLSEGALMWVVGLMALIGVTLWIGAKA
jgi:ubiquinol-cytochrome c reductase cytochrome c subunit